MKGDNLMIVSTRPIPDADLWKLAQDAQTAYRAALKATEVLPTSLDSWLKERTKDIE